MARIADSQGNPFLRGHRTKRGGRAGFGEALHPLLGLIVSGAVSRASAEVTRGFPGT